MKKIKEFENYYINEYGEVFSDKSGKLVKLKPYKCRNGYMSIRLLAEDGKRPHKLIHRLVAEAFIPNEQSLPEVNHKDGNKQNNHKDNLEWSSRKMNIHHSIYVLEKPSVKNYTNCKLYVNGRLIRSFLSIREACEYARDAYDASFSSLYRYKKSKDVEIREVSEECNDYPVARSTMEDELPLEAHCILF